MILISLIVALLFLGAFIWAIKSGQFDDSYGPSVRVLFEQESSFDHQSQITPESDKDKLFCKTLHLKNKK